MILEFILTNMTKVQDGDTELRELAVLSESQAIDISCCFTIHPKGLKHLLEDFSHKFKPNFKTTASKPPNLNQIQAARV